MKTDLAEALSRIEVESEPPQDLINWAAGALVDGRSLDETLTLLVDGGWPVDVAESVVEAARVMTRGERGVVTRGDVVRTLDARYRRSTTGMANFYRAGIGPLGIVAFAMALRQSIAALLHLGRLGKRGRPPVDNSPQT